MNILLQYLVTLGWAITGALSIAVALGIVIKVFSALTPIDEWEELKNGNVAVAIVMAAVLFGGAIVIALAITP